MRYTTVLLPLAQQSCYTYSVPKEYQREIKVGQQVIVPLGRKFYGGIVLSLFNEKPDYEVRPIISIWEYRPIIKQWQIPFWEWIARYYMCEMGEVMAAALPAGFRIESEHKVFLANTDYRPENEREELLLKALQKESLDLKIIEENFGSDFQKFKVLFDSDIVQIQTEYSRQFKPKEVAFLYPKEGITAEQIDERSPLQQQVLLRLLDLAENGKIEKARFLKEESISLSPIKTLMKHGLIREQKEKVYRKSFLYPKEQKEIYKLSKAQEKAFCEIHEKFKYFTTVLLHGVTSSGKTGIYTHLITEQLEQGKTVLFLLPEIALTTQLAERLASFFGKQLLVYHSKYSTNERMEVWQKLQENKQPYVVIGARSSVFLPFVDLGLIIVDEEHEPSFKQQDPAPRYHGRDVAVYLAHLLKCKVLLGSATPSFESYFNVYLEKYGLVNLSERYQSIALPEIKIVDIAEVSRKKRMQGVFSPELTAQIKETLREGQKVILFQNRRGYAYFVKCTNCDAIPHCPNCDVSLSLHQYSSTLQCHYCNFLIPYQKMTCRECQKTDFRPIGFGTEQVQEQAKQLFSNARIDRIDWDTTGGKHSYDKILSRFANGQTDILIGTQMLAKGLDFENVGLVAVLNADLLLHFPDFRSYERSFQLLTQVSGRAGRKNKRGKVLIQTYKPEHPVLKLVQTGDYVSLYNNQVKERSAFGYPPVFHMIVIKLKHKNLQKVKEAATILGADLKGIFKHRTYGAHTPLVSRVKTYYLQEIIIKIERKASYPKAKTLIQESIEKLLHTKGFSSVRIGVDVDVF